MGDRKTVHSGATARKNAYGNQIVYDAELKDVGICQKAVLFCCVCFSCYDKERSYMYLRENALETNVALSICCGFCTSQDCVNVNYFDRAPYSKTCHFLSPPCCCFFTCDQPKLEIVDQGFMCCCAKCDPCCCGKTVVLMPFENFPIPCCCCVNRVNCCDNCFGLCGPITGNPKIFSGLFPQPKDAEAFVAAAQSTMLNYQPPGAMTELAPTGATTNPIATAEVVATPIDSSKN